jgi:hypothetical protein
MSRQAVTITDTDIVLLAEYFAIKDNTCANKEWLLDIFSTHYNNQQIIVNADDGENLTASGFLEFLETVCEIFKIDKKSVIVNTHDSRLTEPFTFNTKTLGVFVSANKFIPQFKKDQSQAKFVGTIIGRFTPTRMRLAYELDQTFSTNAYIVFQSWHWWHHEPFTEIYKTEQEWFANKTFDSDLVSSARSGRIPPADAFHNYPNCWNHYQIEVVCETDPFGDFWFTEKLAKPLATGKPFLLVSGPGTLERIKSMGFETFGSVIDESYDRALTPTKRIHAIVNSLQMLYNDTNKSEKIAEMYQIANRNQEYYKKFATTQGQDVQSKI